MKTRIELLGAGLPSVPIVRRPCTPCRPAEHEIDVVDRLAGVDNDVGPIGCRPFFTIHRNDVDLLGDHLHLVTAVGVGDGPTGCNPYWPSAVARSWKRGRPPRGGRRRG